MIYMYCKVCGEYKEEGFKMFGINMCNNCFEQIAYSKVSDDKYDLYKNLVRILLSYYIGGKQELRVNN